MNKGRKELFEAKEKFHVEQASLPFAEKIKVLAKLQELAKTANKYKTLHPMGEEN